MGFSLGPSFISTSYLSVTHALFPLLYSSLLLYEKQVLSGTDVEQRSLAVYKECIRYTTHELLPSIIAKINEDPEDNGLKPFTIVSSSSSPDEDKSNISMKHMSNIKGLDLNIFRGRRTALLGDSTLFYPTQWFYPMMTHLNDEEENGTPKYDEMSLSEASEVVKKRAGILGVKLPDTRGKELMTDSTDNTLIQWAGVRGPGASKTLETRISGMIETVSQLNPHVLVANMGLHWLHLHPLVPKDGIVIHRWVQYKNTWLQKVYNLAMDMNETTLLLFKTTNFVCDSKRTGDWEKYSNLYLSMDNRTIETCYEENKQFVGTYDLTKSQVYDYCRFGQFTEIGVQHYNSMVYDFVREVHENQTDSRLTVGVFNDHDVESCESTNDAIHHREKMEIRLRLLSNTIESYLGCRNINPQLMVETTAPKLGV